MKQIQRKPSIRRERKILKGREEVRRIVLQSRLAQEEREAKATKERKRRIKQREREKADEEKKVGWKRTPRASPTKKNQASANRRNDKEETRTPTHIHDQAVRADAVEEEEDLNGGGLEDQEMDIDTSATLSKPQNNFDTDMDDDEQALWGSDDEKIEAELCKIPTHRITPVFSSESLETKVQNTIDKYNLLQPRDDQLQPIYAGLRGADVYVRMATGGGKTLIALVTALADYDKTSSVTLIVSPLIMLIKDQILKQPSDLIRALYGKMPLQEQAKTWNALQKHEVAVLYLTPEQLPKVLQELDCLTRVVFDEAHCVVSWAHFKECYQNLDFIKDKFPTVPITTLTATSNSTTEEKIIRKLGMQNLQRFIHPVSRHNLFYEVVLKLPSKQKEKDLKDMISWIETRFDNQSGIVYCGSVQTTKDLAKMLQNWGLSAVAIYGDKDAEEKSDALEQWLRGSIKIVVATTAFSLGIDKPDVRFVVHYGLPRTMESYFQTTGRAGRDGQPAHCRLYFSFSDSDVCYREAHERKRDGCEKEHDAKTSSAGAKEASLTDEQAKRDLDHSDDILQASQETLAFAFNSRTCRRYQLATLYDEQVSKRCRNCDACYYYIFKECGPSIYDLTVFAREAVTAFGRVLQERIDQSKSLKISITDLKGALPLPNQINVLFPKKKYGTALHYLVAVGIFRRTVVKSSEYYCYYLELGSNAPNVGTTGLDLTFRFPSLPIHEFLYSLSPSSPLSSGPIRNLRHQATPIRGPFHRPPVKGPFSRPFVDSGVATPSTSS